MGHVEVAHVEYHLPDGRLLLDDVSFRVGEGSVCALVGANGAGKTTLLRLISGELTPDGGSVTVSGGLGVMPQFVGSVRDERTVRDLLVSVSSEALRAAARAVDETEFALMERDDEANQMAYARALGDWGDARGYEAEVVWDKCTTAALNLPYEKTRRREVRTLSGGERKRLVLEALLLGGSGVLLLDEPDNYLDVPGKQWLEERLRETRKTVLFVSHDRELLARAAKKIISVEPGPVGGTRSTPSSRNSSPTCDSTPRAATKWLRATTPHRPVCASSRRPERLPLPRGNRRSPCACAAGGPVSAPSPAKGSNSAA